MILHLSRALELDPSDAVTGVHVRQIYIPKARREVERTKAMIAESPQAAKDLGEILADEEALLACLVSRFSLPQGQQVLAL